MNFPLEKLEIHVDDASLVEGETLFGEGMVRDLMEVERHLWLARVEDETGTFEVEVKLSPSKVVAATCECARFREEKQCGHFTAVLLSLRRKATEKKNAGKKRKKHNKKNKKLTTGVVLDNVEHEELVSFVKQYAKTNRNFALALKARFTSNVSIIESKEKYLQLLESTLSVARNQDRTISLRGGRKLRKVLIEMHGQIEEAIHRQHYPEAITMAQSMIEKITPILRKMETMQEEVREQLIGSFRALQVIVERKPAPDLLNQLWEYCLEESRKLTYRNNEIDLQFFRLLTILADEPRRYDQLSTLLNEQVTRYLIEDRSAAPLIALLVKLLDKQNQTAAIFQLLSHNLADPEVLRFGIRFLQQQGDGRQARKLALKGLEYRYPPAIREEIEEQLFLIARQESDTETIARYARQRFLKTLDFQYYDSLKEASPEQWPEIWEQLHSALQQLPFSIEKREAIARLYLREEKHDQLINYLQQCRSIDLLRLFAPPLLSAGYHKALYDLYCHILHHYLENHLGRKNSRKIRDAVLDLQEKAGEEMAGKVVEHLRITYPERHSLMEELEIFKAVE